MFLVDAIVRLIASRTLLVTWLPPVSVYCSRYHLFRDDDILGKHNFCLWSLLGSPNSDKVKHNFV